MFLRHCCLVPDAVVGELDPKTKSTELGFDGCSWYRQLENPIRKNEMQTERRTITSIFTSAPPLLQQMVCTLSQANNKVILGTFSGIPEELAFKVKCCLRFGSLRHTAFQKDSDCLLSL